MGWAVLACCCGWAAGMSDAVVAVEGTAALEVVLVLATSLGDGLGAVTAA